jgi:hypothetical protein
MEPDQLKYSLTSSYQWIYNSFYVNQFKGSSAYYSLFKGWSSPYPETSGYLIPSLLNYNEIKPANKNLQLIELAVKWLLSLQKTDGSFRKAENSDQAIVFDTAQIFLGLQAYQAKYASPQVEEALEKTFLWLLSCIGDSGFFTQDTYRSHSPSYHSRVLWPMLQYSLSNNSISKDLILDSMKAYSSKQNDNGSFENWGLEPTDIFGLTHTIAYTLRGFLEIGLLLNEDQYFEIVKKSLGPLLQTYAEKGELAGSYSQDWQGDYSFVCNSGNAQLAIILYKLAAVPNQREYELIADKLLEDLVKKQCWLPLKVLHGGVFSSSPFYGKYQRFKITNWTIKFYMDMIMYKLNFNNKTS